jgi:hypothetical protein
MVSRGAYEPVDESQESGWIVRRPGVARAWDQHQLSAVVGGEGGGVRMRGQRVVFGVDDRDLGFDSRQYILQRQRNSRAEAANDPPRSGAGPVGHLPHGAEPLMRVALREDDELLQRRAILRVDRGADGQVEASLTTTTVPSGAR